MQIEYCDSCKMKLSDAEFESDQAVWIKNEPYCKACGEKVRAAMPASKSGPKPAARSGPRPGAGSGIRRATPSGTRAGISRTTPTSSRMTPSRSGRRISTPSGSKPRRSGIANRAVAGESGSQTHRTSPHPQEGPSMVVVSVVGAAIGILLAIIVIMAFLR